MSSVLLVDDDPIVTLLAGEALARAGFRIECLHDLESARERLRGTPPAIVILDVMIERADGTTFCRELRHDPRWADVPVLMMTSLDDEATIARVYEAGATDFVAKPVSPTLLVHRVRYMLRSAELQRMERRVSRRRARAQRLVKVAHWELDTTSGRFRWSDEARTVFGLPALEGGYDALLDYVHPGDRERVRRALDQAEGGEIEYRLLHADGVRVVHQVSELVTDERAPLKLGAVVDVTELRDAERRVVELAYFDPLTGLGNRRLLQRYLGEAVEAAARDEGRIAVLAIDLDGFKQVNDTLGHPAGDALLREVAARLIERTHPRAEESTTPDLAGQLARDALVARTGGDEFVIVLRSAASLPMVEQFAEDVGRALSTPLQLLGSDVIVGSSVGIAQYPSDARDAGLLLERADAALYDAKTSGRGIARPFTPVLLEKARKRLELENALRRALAGDGSLHLEFQPKVRIPEHRMVGVEALVRLSQEGRPVSPAEFIPLAEEAGLIHSLGCWVLRAACAQAQSWNLALETPISVAVNASTRELQRPDYARTVSRALEEAGLSPSLLEIEVTESGAMADDEASIATITALKAIGVRIALDDFGTGYSSLSRLLKLPIDTLKLDRSFVRELVGHARSRSITSAVLALAASLGIAVVVEGVETPEQLAIVTALGPLDIQGFLFARPMRAEHLLAWKTNLEARRRRLSIAA